MEGWFLKGWFQAGKEDSRRRIRASARSDNVVSESVSAVGTSVGLGAGVVWGLPLDFRS